MLETTPEPDFNDAECDDETDLAVREPLPGKTDEETLQAREELAPVSEADFYGVLDDEESIAVVLEPLPGHSDDEIAQSLKESGASKIEILAPGFISAEAKPSTLESMRQIAQLNVKQRKQLRPQRRFR